MFKNLKSKLKFLRRYLKNPKEVGAVLPSSRFLTAKMLEPINFENTRLMVELGSGDGKFTREILKRLPMNAVLLALEINQDFIAALNNIKDPRLKIINESAERLNSILDDLRLPKADYVLSGLPLVSFSQDLRSRILCEAASSLKQRGSYIQFTYFPFHNKIYKEHFSSVSIDGFTLLNVPPAFVLVCQK